MLSVIHMKASSLVKLELFLCSNQRRERSTQVSQISHHGPTQSGKHLEGTGYPACQFYSHSRQQGRWSFLWVPTALLDRMKTLRVCNLDRIIWFRLSSSYNSRLCALSYFTSENYIRIHGRSSWWRSDCVVSHYATLIALIYEPIITSIHKRVNRL